MAVQYRFYGSAIPTSTATQIELVAAVAGVVGVYLMMRESVWNYPVGLVWAILYAWFFFAVLKQYGDFAVSLITAFYLIEGWRNWSRNTAETKESYPVRRIEKIHIAVVAATLIAGIPLVYGLLIALKGQFPLADSITTCLALSAQYLTNRKVLESWWFWAIGNAVYIGVFYVRGYPTTMILYSLFFIMAFVGYIQWRASFNSAKSVPLVTG